MRTFLDAVAQIGDLEVLFYVPDHVPVTPENVARSRSRRLPCIAGRPPWSPLYSTHVFQHLDVERVACSNPRQASVLVFKSLEPPRIIHLKAAVLPAPQVQRFTSDAGPPNHLSYIANALGFLQHAENLRIG